MMSGKEFGESVSVLSAEQMALISSFGNSAERKGLHRGSVRNASSLFGTSIKGSLRTVLKKLLFSMDMLIVCLVFFVFIVY